MKSNHRRKGSIYESKFGYRSELEVDTKLSLDMNELSEITLRPLKVKVKILNEKKVLKQERD